MFFFIKSLLNSFSFIICGLYIPVINHFVGSSWSWSYGSWIYLCNQCFSPLMLWVRISIMARCKTLCDKVCQWLATGRWFSPGPLVSSTNATDRHDIAEYCWKWRKTPSSKQTNCIFQITTCHYQFLFQQIKQIKG
jgi:hypothetical protein